jgi:GNAT superfamily N-acetyltransferase
MIDCEISFDPLRIDFVAAATLLAQSYWGIGRTEGDQLKAFSNSICVAVFVEGKQVAFGRAITDRVYSAYLCDIIVWPDWRGKGIGKAIVKAFLEHPDLANVPSWTLKTRDAHALYEKFGFERFADANQMRLSRSRDR